MENDHDVAEDAAVYRRTGKGQQELLVASRRLTLTERRLLAMVTGFTDLRVLLDLGVHAREARAAVTRLLALALIERVSSHG